MKIAGTVSQRLEQFSPGEVFTIRDFSIDPRDQSSLVKYLNRKVERNEIARLSKGRYYKPRTTRFGQVPPGLEESLKDLLFKDGMMCGYISGVPAFAKLGLTTQIASELFIGSSIYRRPMQRGNYRIRFSLQRNPITEYTIPFLQLLDAIKQFREIPGTTSEEAIRYISEIISEQSVAEQNKLAQLTLRYPSYVRALTGAIFENIGLPSEDLRLSLNGVTTYKLNISTSVLPTKANWNIV